MQVLSVNVGQPRIVQWRGRLVRTSIYKSPVRGPVDVARVSLHGDEQSDASVHGGRTKAVYAYPSEHFAWWVQQLDGVEVGPCLFGENLTLAGFDEASVAVGDRLHVGSATLVVTEPRTPCFKLSMRVGVGAVVPMMIQSGRSGFYMSVQRPGQVTAGDAIMLEATHEPRLTIAELLRLTREGGPADEQAMCAWAVDGRVTSDWQAKLSSRVARLSTSGEPAATIDCAVTAVIEEAEDVRSVHLRAPAVASRALPGQYVVLDVPDAGQRCYSISSASGDELRITVKRSGDSQPGPRYIHALRAGDRVRVVGPQGSFCLHPGASQRPLLLVAGGIGITPIVAMANGAAQGSGRRIHVVYVVREPERAALAGELQAWARPPVRTVALHMTGAGSLRERFLPGRPDFARVVDQLGTDIDVFVCGPAAMLAAAPAALSAAGVTPARIRTERFVGAPADLSTLRVPPGGLPVWLGDRRATWTSMDQTLLDLADSCGVEIPSACRSGKCGTCLSRVADGEVVHIAEVEMPLDVDECLPCVAVPITPLRLEVVR